LLYPYSTSFHSFHSYTFLSHYSTLPFLLTNLIIWQMSVLIRPFFFQVNQRGEPISVHNRPSCVIIGISAVNPSSPIPDTMLVLKAGRKTGGTGLNLHFCLMMILPFFYRILPLKFVELSVHSTEKHRLMLKLVNGHSYYLELCAPPNQQQHLFHLWLQLISLLKPPQKIRNTEVDFLIPTSPPPLFYSFVSMAIIAVSLSSAFHTVDMRRQTCCRMANPVKQIKHPRPAKTHIHRFRPAN
uniref:Golgi associated RAB2 interactor protein-like Rab2B-binding domain-containing protein n=1 Tax=Athene cunicularia TaxID=194338 RepID=A0A663MPM5_ATHCN